MKSTEQLCLTTLKSDAKFEEKLTLASKNDMRNWVNFIMQAVGSVEIFTLIGYFSRMDVMFELKKYTGLCRWFKNDLSPLVNFHTSS